MPGSTCGGSSFIAIPGHGQLNERGRTAGKRARCGDGGGRGGAHWRRRRRRRSCYGGESGGGGWKSGGDGRPRDPLSTSAPPTAVSPDPEYVAQERPLRILLLAGGERTRELAAGARDGQPGRRCVNHARSAPCPPSPTTEPSPLGRFPRHPTSAPPDAPASQLFFAPPLRRDARVPNATPHTHQQVAPTRHQRGFHQAQEREPWERKCRGALSA